MPNKEEKEEKAETEEKAEEQLSKKDILELSAKIDKMSDAFNRVADVLTSKQEDEEEKPKEDEEKQMDEEEEKPEEEEKQEDEEEKPKDEEEMKEEKIEKSEDYFEEKEEKTESKKGTKIERAIKEEVAKQVEKELKKSLGSGAVKRTKVIKKGAGAVTEQSDLVAFAKTPWRDIHAMAQAKGA